VSSHKELITPFISLLAGLFYLMQFCLFFSTLNMIHHDLYDEEKTKPYLKIIALNVT